MTLQYTVTEDDMIDWAKHISKKMKMTPFQIVWLIVTSLGISYLVFEMVYTKTIYVISIILIIIFVPYIMFYRRIVSWIDVRNFRKSLKKEYHPALGEKELQLSNGILSRVSRTQKIEDRVESITGVESTGKNLLFQIGQQYIIIPERAFESVEQRQTFLNMVTPKPSA